MILGADAFPSFTEFLSTELVLACPWISVLLVSNGSVPAVSTEGSCVYIEPLPLEMDQDFEQLSLCEFEPLCLFFHFWFPAVLTLSSLWGTWRDNTKEVVFPLWLYLNSPLQLKGISDSKLLPLSVLKQLILLICLLKLLLLRSENTISVVYFISLTSCSVRPSVWGICGTSVSGYESFLIPIDF